MVDEHARKRVVIIGAGFGGLQAARALANKDIDVLIIDRQNYHLFQPLLYQVATGTLEQESIAHPVRSIIRRWRNVKFLMAEVLSVDFEKREICTSAGDCENTVSYDYLIIAAGAATNFFGLDHVEQQAFDLKDLDDATRLRNQVLGVFEQAVQESNLDRRAALTTFVIVGAGPTGVEFAGALAELIHGVLVRDYPELDMDGVRILLVDKSERPLPAMPENLSAYTAKRLESMGVELWMGAGVQDMHGDLISFEDGRELHAHTLHWAAGVRAAPLADTLDAEQVRGGRVVVTPELTLPAYPEVYVIGDMAYTEQDGKPLPQMAPVAIQHGTYSGKAIWKRASGQAVKPFRYINKGSMAVIGRGKAVASGLGLRLTGFPAWVMWLLLHLYYLIDFRNRLVVLLNWAYDYLFFDRKVRLIVQETDSSSLPATHSVVVEYDVEADEMEIVDERLAV